MFSINTENNEIRLSQGDQVQFDVYVNTALWPQVSTYEFKPNNDCYLQFNMYYINDYCNPVLTKKYYDTGLVETITEDSETEKTYTDFITSAGNMIFHIEPEDTECLEKAQYRYDVIACIKVDDTQTTQKIIDKNVIWII